MNSNKNNEYDVDIAVVGAGPAGATAAYILSRKGYNVLLLDKARFPREKLCGGCLTAKTLRLLDRVFTETPTSLTQKNIINFSSSHYQIRCKSRILIDKYTHLPFYFVDRTSYDYYLFQKAKDAGAIPMEEEKIVELKQNPSSGNYSLVTSNGHTVSPRFIIAADGVNSTIRSKLFLQHDSKKKLFKQWKNHLAFALETFIPRDTPFEFPNFPILFYGCHPHGYGWLFPNKTRWVLGIGGLNTRNFDLKTTFQHFLSSLNDDISRTDTTKTTGFPIPLGNFVKKPVFNNIILAGDAGGFVDPMLGEGIFHAHKTGELAAYSIINAIENNTPIAPFYQEQLQTTLFPEFIYAKHFSRLLFNPVNRYLGFPLIKQLDRYFDKLAEVIHGDRTYRWFKKKNF